MHIIPAFNSGVYAAHLNHLVLFVVQHVAAEAGCCAHNRLEGCVAGLRLEHGFKSIYHWDDMMEERTSTAGHALRGLQEGLKSSTASQ